MSEPKVGVNVRLKPESIRRIEDLAKHEQRNRSDMIRLLILEGLQVYERRQR